MDTMSLSFLSITPSNWWTWVSKWTLVSQTQFCCKFWPMLLPIHQKRACVAGRSGCPTQCHQLTFRVHVSLLFTDPVQGSKVMRWAVPHLKCSFPEWLSQVIQIHIAHIRSVVSSCTSGWSVYFDRPPGCIIPHSYLSRTQEICPVCLSGQCYHFCPVMVTASCLTALILWQDPAYLSQGAPLRLVSQMKVSQSACKWRMAVTAVLHPHQLFHYWWCFKHWNSSCLFSRAPTSC